MSIFLYILTHNILPIIAIVGIGFLLGKIFTMDVKTLSKVQFYAFVPVFTFYQIYTTDLPDNIGWVLVFVLSLMACNFLLSLILGRIRRYKRSMQAASINSLIFYNSGNIGIPVITLVFSGVPFLVDGQTPYLATALAIQVTVLVLQNFGCNVFGFYIAGAGKKMSVKEAVKSVVQMPTLYSVPLAFIFKYLIKYDLTEFPLWTSLTYLKDGLVPMALITLGVQLSHTKISHPSLDVGISVALRLFGGPALAILLCSLFRFDPLTCQVLMISSGVPTALNTALIAAEKDNEPRFASQAVLFSTILCPISLTLMVYAAQIFFPL